MQETKITTQNLLPLLLEEASRKRILKKYQAETGRHLIFRNHLSDIAIKVELNLEEAQALKTVLLDAGYIGKQILKDFIAQVNFPTPILFELLAESECLTALAHRRGPIDFLLQFARTTEGHEEAILTIGKYYYSNKEISSEEFQAFLEEFGYSEWLLTALLHSIHDNNEKAKVFNDYVHNSSNNYELKEIYEELQMERELLITTDKSLLKTKHKTKNPKFLRAIAQNTATPIKVLLSLKKINRIKYAGSIRNYAVETLAKIKAAK